MEYNLIEREPKRRTDMTAWEFWTSFEKQIKDNSEVLKTVWNNRDAFTERIMKVIKNAIRMTNREAKDYVPNHRYEYEEYVMQTEYFKIDLVAWEQKRDTDAYTVENGIEGYKLNKHAWDFDIAVEHENASDKWSDEVVKLAHIFCDLRVVIGYIPYVKDGKREMHKKYLNAITDSIKTLKCRDNMKHGKYMIILGDVEHGESDGFEELIYTPYIFDKEKEKFEPLVKEQ